MKRQVNACRQLTPGPVSIEASVLEAMTCCPSPADAAFISMMEDVRSRLLRVAGMRPAEYAAVLMAGPCAFALEAALTTLIPEESRVLVVCNGAVSGLRNDLGEIGRAVRAAGRTFIVDAGVSFGATSIDAEALGIDVLLSVADCGLKGVSGLSFVLARRNILESRAASRSTSSKACAGRKPASKTPCRLRPSPPCMPRWTLSTRRAAPPCARRPVARLPKSSPPA